MGTGKANGIGAADFWAGYKQELVRQSNREHWANDTDWTKLCINAAENTLRGCRIAGREDLVVLKTSREYFKIDLVGEINYGDCDWTLEVAFEHENEDNNRWIQEFCKLSHVAANLRVIAAYFDPRCGKPAEEFLQERVDLMESRGNRITRSGGNWLFIFGPKRKTNSPDGRFSAFTLDGTIVKELHDDQPLRPCDWPSLHPIS